MSIILKGIDMPKNGDYHHITIYDNGNTYITTSNVLYETDRKDVKVIQIPKPHGRLIDGGELYKDFENHCSGECDCCVHETENYNCGLIANALTILEAEE